MRLAKIDADDRVDPLLRVLVGTDAAVGDRGRLVQLHVRRDRRADDRHREEQERLAADEVGPQGVLRDLPQSGSASTIEIGYARNTKREQQEDPLRPPVGPEARTTLKITRRRDRHRDVAGDAEDLHRRADAGELRDDEPEVRDQQADHRERAHPQRELLAHERDQALAGVRAEPGRHLLHDHERHGDSTMTNSIE